MSLKKYIKQFIPNNVIDIVDNYRRVKRLKSERKEEIKSEEFKNRKRFYSQFLNQGNIYFDIGANYGNRIGPITALKLKRIVAVEPQQYCCDHLKKKYKEITVLQMGVGAENDEKDFFLSNESVLSSFSTEFINSTKETRFTENTWEHKEKVEMITLDRLIVKYGMPDFIKI